MFADEARFGRMNRPRPCWAPTGVRPEVASQFVRGFIYLYGAISPKSGASAFLILPSSDTVLPDILRRLGQEVLQVEQPVDRGWCR